LIDKDTDELYAKAFDIGAASDEAKVKHRTADIFLILHYYVLMPFQLTERIFY
jgi:hypothetical protein